jgi:hypothetical protein
MGEWRWVVSFTPLPLYPRGNSPRYPLHRPQSLSGRGGKEKSLAPAGNRTRAVQPFAIPTPEYLCTVKERRHHRVSDCRPNPRTFFYSAFVPFCRLQRSVTWARPSVADQRLTDYVTANIADQAWPVVSTRWPSDSLRATDGQTGKCRFDSIRCHPQFRNFGLSNVMSLTMILTWIPVVLFILF